jgi:hypothetical protein
VRARLVNEITSSNPVEVMFFFFLCVYVVLSCVGRGLCNGLITSPEKSNRASNCVSIRNLNTEEDKAQTWAVVL